MKKTQRQIDSLYELLKEQAEIEKNITALPRGYISKKTISGHVYNYRQWREGTKIVSEYVPEAFLGGVLRKISARKEHEASLRLVKKELKNLTRRLLRQEAITEEEIEDLRVKANQEVNQ